MQVNKCGLFQRQWRGLAVEQAQTTPGKFCNFYSHLWLQTVFSALKLTQNCYINMNISFFFLKTAI